MSYIMKHFCKDCNKEITTLEKYPLSFSYCKECKKNHEKDPKETEDLYEFSGIGIGLKLD